MATNSNGAARRNTSTKANKRATREQTSEERVRVLAYQVYERRQSLGMAGDSYSDWLEAERLLSIGEA